MSSRWKLLYPFLFAVLPILAIINKNPGAANLPDIVVVIGTMLVGCAVVYGLVALAAGSRRRWSPGVALIVLAVIVWFYWYDALIGWGRRLWPAAPPAAVLAIAGVITILGVWWLARRSRYIDRVSTFLTMTGLLMVAWSGAKLVKNLVHSRSVVRNSILAKKLARPIGLKHATAPAGGQARRDIYLILLDEYANSNVLREEFGFDNGEFEDSLRELGFTIPRVIHSNYIHTTLSLPSLLNFAHMTPLTSDVGAQSADPTLPDYLLENNRTAAFLQAQGYKFLFFPSQWWPATHQNRLADWQFHAWTGFDLGHEATRSDLRRSVVNTTMLNLLRKNYRSDADYVKRSLAGLEQVPERAEPTFAFAHIINPHRPFSLASDCKARIDLVPLAGAWGEIKRNAYVDQLHCLNHLVLGVVTTLLQRSSIPPIILLQGDHGTPSLRYEKAKSASAVSTAQARERFGAFGAYYLPGGGGKLVADSVTLVNIFQKVLTYYFDADIEAAPDRLYLSMDQTPYSFVELDPASLVLPVSAGAQPKLDPEPKHEVR